MKFFSNKKAPPDWSGASPDFACCLRCKSSANPYDFIVTSFRKTITILLVPSFFYRKRRKQKAPAYQAGEGAHKNGGSSFHL